MATDPASSDHDPDHGIQQEEEDHDYENVHDDIHHLLHALPNINFCPITGAILSTLSPLRYADYHNEDTDDHDSTALHAPSTPPTPTNVHQVVKPPPSSFAATLTPLHSTPASSLHTLIRSREFSLPKPHPTNTHMASKFLPDTTTALVDQVESPVYNGTFSQDGSFFYAGTRQFSASCLPHSCLSVCILTFKSPPVIHLYDSSNGDFTKIKSIQAHPGRWTITCCSLSPDNQTKAYFFLTCLSCV
ncbi:hypothetical protein SeMB42_g07002 [Synchytrium endobioticum]|uniref:Uncharacterized protein n=1 Tax=Synchytrium endobioticum TaxID=286115 RepID=A0A507CH78_9FUNG|nr:hypothetical protein SeMB42_g07002 [Synchytrium endobioticum]TPX37364.1 hypothetical protein SeLEV6574_g07906 [Synchytrium endobioticum]